MKDETARNRWHRWLAPAVGLALGLTLFGTVGPSGALAQDDAVVVGGGANLAEGASASDIEALVNSIFAEIFGSGAADDSEVTDDGASSGGDINVGGNMGGSVTMGGGMGGDISIGGATGGVSVGETESGG